MLNAIKEFLKPNWWKLLLFVVMVVWSLSAIYDHSNYKARGFPFEFYQEWKDSRHVIKFGDLMWNIITWYLFACLVYFILLKFKNIIFKLNPEGRVKASLILPIIAIVIPIIFLGTFFLSIQIVPNPMSSSAPQGAGFIALIGVLSLGLALFFGLVSPVLAITGLVLGILGLKSTKKNLAIAGIGLSALVTIGALFVIFYSFMVK